MITLLCVVASAVLLGVGLATGVVVLSYAALAVALVGIAVWLFTYIRERSSASKHKETTESAVDSQDSEPADSADEASSEETTSDGSPAVPEEATSDDQIEPVEHAEADDGLVVVIPGRKRYHRADCGNLNGEAREELTLGEARQEGFTPCTTCSS